MIRTKHCLGDQIEKNEMGGLFITYGGEERCIQGFGGGNLRERDHLENLIVGWRTILKQIFKKCDGALPVLLWFKIGDAGANAVMNQRVP